jgi:hypothetical protein
MFVPFLAASIVGLSFIKLGAMSVMVQVLSAALILTLVIIAAGIAYLVWRRFSKE